MEYCRDGFVVLVNWTIDQMAVYNPLTRSLDLFPTPPEEICCDMYVEFHMLASEEKNGPFHIVSVAHEDCGAQAAVFSSDSKEWKVFPFSEDGYSSLNGTLVNGSVYWTFTSGDSIRVLNTATLQFSQIEPPLHMEGQEKFKPGETKDGRLCLVCTVKHKLVVWVWRPDDSGINIWMLDKTFPLDTRYCLDDDVSLNVVAIIGGFVYLTTFCERRPNSCHFMCFCIETEELNKLCTVTHSTISYPYIMAFPPLLVCNKVNPQLKGA
jgi:F-box interacting protein